VRELFRQHGKAYLVFKGIDRNLAKVSPSASDAEKADNFFCHLFGAPADSGDAFAKFFSDNTIDPETGALLGRYIAEERDSGRRIATTLRKNVNREDNTKAAVDLRAEIKALRAELEALRNQGRHSRNAA
jgi:hypothetical protein